MPARLKLTPEVTQAIAESVKVGIPLELAANREGLSRRAVMGWLAKGRADDAEDPYLSFALAIDKANADCASYLAKNLMLQAKKDPRAAQWLLERRYAKHFGAKQQVEHSGKVEFAGASFDDLVKAASRRAEGDVDD